MQHGTRRLQALRSKDRSQDGNDVYFGDTDMVYTL